MNYRKPVIALLLTAAVVAMSFAVIPGDYGGKPRPAVIAQRNGIVSDARSIIICPITSTLQKQNKRRIDLIPSAENGLDKPCQIMVDKLYTIKRERIKRHLGQVSAVQANQLTDAICALFSDV